MFRQTHGQGMRCKSILRVESQMGTRLVRENGFCTSSNSHSSWESGSTWLWGQNRWHCYWGPPEFNLVGGVLCLVGLLIRLGLMLHWGASDLLAVKLPLLYFHKDSIGYMSTQTHFLRSLKGELFQSNFFFPDNLYLIVWILFPCSPKCRLI